MEMDSISADDIEANIGESSEQLTSPYASYLNGIYGEPEMSPRVGDQYQVEIPPLVEECDRLSLTRPADSKPALDAQDSFSLGLAIPLMWTKGEKFSGFRESKEESNSTASNENARPKPKAEAVGRRHTSPIVLALPSQSNCRYGLQERPVCAFPGSLGELWEDAECQRFLLGLYIFGKNLTVVKKFVDSKKMGDILAFYYGKFYRSSEYRRWAEGRNLKSRRFVHGQKLLVSWRQEELLSRISLNVSEECKNMLLEVSRTFKEEKISLEEYIFALRKAVGIDILIEAIAIGKGKKDLTSTAMEPPKTNHVLSSNSEVPIGKACSSLSSTEIIKFLTGGFRLSKARSSDLFWEAVWPRLLARGWHSEQPKDHTGSRNSLVFLTPGVKKFSRRRLVKGNHYFDSVTDILNKVASEPGLLELETESAKESGDNKENGEAPLIKDGPDDLSSNKRHRYLQPRNLSQNRDVMKFMIVDTSMVQVAEQRKVRELRSLPVETANVLIISSSSSSGSEKDSGDEPEDTNTTTSNSNKETIDKEVGGDSSVFRDGTLDNGKSNSSSQINVSTKNHASQNMVSLNENPRKKLKVKPDSTKYLSIDTKQSSVSACTDGESSRCVETVSRKRKQKNEKSHRRSNLPDEYDTMAYETVLPQKLSSASSVAEGSSAGRKEGATSIERDVSQEKTEPVGDFDLNVPQVSLDVETDETVIKGMVQNAESSCTGQSSVQAETSMQCDNPEELPNGEESIDQKPNRRQSTRSRPLTTKALEAFAFGYLGSPKKKRKDSEASRRPKSSRRVRSRTVITADFRNGVGDDAPNPSEVG